LVLYVPSSFADPITFTYQGTATGSIGGTPFANTAFTITARGDTANRGFFDPASPITTLPSRFVYFIIHDSASISLDGVGNFAFITSTSSEVRNNTGVVVFRNNFAGFQLLQSELNLLYTSWDMLSSIGPVAGTGTVSSSWIFSAVQTTGGRLVFDSGQAPLTFTATVAPVPEPGTVLLLGSGVAGIAVKLKRRKKQSSI